MTKPPFELRLDRTAVAVSGVALALTATAVVAPAWLFVWVGLGFAVAPLGLAAVVEYRRRGPDAVLAGAVTDDRARAVAAELQAYAGLTEIVRSQLVGVNAEMSTAVLQLIEQLQHIDGGVESILAAIDDSARKSAALLTRSIEDAALKRAQFDAATNRLTCDVLRDDEQVRLVLADTERVFGTIAEIGIVADATKRLAAQASAQAPCAGDAGLSFCIIARDLHALCVRSIALAERVEVDVQTALRAIDRYRSDIQTRLQLSRDEAAIGDEFAAFTGRLTQLMETQTDAAQHVARRGEEVAAHVVAILANLQFQDVTRQQVDHVIEALVRFESHNADVRQFLLGMDAAQNPPTIQPLLDGMYARYVMERQRSIHTATLTDDEPEARPAQPVIELF